MPEPKQRPSCWLSTAYPTGSSDPQASLCSAEYQVSTGNTPLPERLTSRATYSYAQSYICLMQKRSIRH